MRRSHEIELLVMSMAHGRAVEKSTKVLSMQTENWQRSRGHKLILVSQRLNEYDTLTL